ncbi:aromatic acid exporter family protein [Lagierella sp.]|uniref:FUSC family protein n=1 Tax=Lagierella sp. TaxID=2849657 RepID=UPI00260C6761|nr:aromatic acid exporter family protein [Lagierella sp.]
MKNQKISDFLNNVFGLRTVKTAVATTISYYVAKAFGLNNPILASISAVVSMSSSIFDSYTISINRMISTIVGAVIAVLLQYVDLVNPVTMLLGVVLIINICNYFGWKKSIVLSCIVFIVILVYKPISPSSPTFEEYALFRISDTALGLIIGFFINYLVFPPNRFDFILQSYHKTLLEFEKTFLRLLESKKNIDIDNLLTDINEINSEFKSLRNDKKLKKSKNIRLAEISGINSDFYTAFGFISQLAESGHVAKLTKENQKKINQYYKATLEINEDSSIEDEEYMLAFNYYLDELMNILFKLRQKIEEFEQKYSN